MQTDDPFMLARNYIGKVIYRRYVEMDEAPSVVNCITFVRWFYERQGISLPSDYLEWLTLGDSVERSNLACFDIVFTDGYRSQVVEHVGRVGHVGIVTDKQTILHATTNVGIEEIPLDDFFRKRTFCCARRIMS